jgi:hypothetical protein
LRLRLTWLRHTTAWYRRLRLVAGSVRIVRLLWIGTVGVHRLIVAFAGLQASGDGLLGEEFESVAFLKFKTLFGL